MLIGVNSVGFDALQSSAAAAFTTAAPQKMLTDRICETYQGTVERLSNKLEVLGVGTDDGEGSRLGRPIVFKTDATTWLATPDLHHEVFGAAGMVVGCDDLDQMLAVAEALEGQLTATLQLDMPTDREVALALLPALRERAGRILCNGYPTGVEVASAMTHGGPYPAATDSRATSVGTMAINRWLRPISYQDFPHELLPKSS